jgi:hypothetical protein
MPDFPMLTGQQLGDLRQYIRTEAARLRDKEIIVKNGGKP